MREPVEVMLAANAAMNRRDPDGMLAHYAPDAVVRDHRAVPFGDYTGHSQLHDLYSGILGLASEFTEHLEFLAVDGERVVADCEVSARLADDPTGRIVGAEYGYIATVRDDLVVSLDLYDDGQAALDASGLRST
jgi:ketosteroid isomerase-like protein